MPRYARLKEPGFDTDDSEFFEVGEVGLNFLEKIADVVEPAVKHSSEDEQLRAQQQQQKSTRDHIYSVPSTEILNSTQGLQYSSKRCPDNCRAQQPQQEKQNIENGNPNVRSADLSPALSQQPTVVATSPHSSTASGASLQEQLGGGGRAGASGSGRWAGRSSEEQRSGRCRAVECESHYRDSPTSFPDNDNLNFHSPPSGQQGGQWVPSIHRGTPYREREPVLDRQSREAFTSRGGPQQQAQQHPNQAYDKQSCTLHSSCNDVRHCQRFYKESSPRECLFTDPMTAPDKKPLPPVMQSRADASHGGGYFSSQERVPTFQRSNSARTAPGLQRSTSTRDTPGHPSEMSLENWRDHPGSRSSQGPERTKHRVSFSLTENHELETQKLREKWREPTAHRKKVLQAKQDTNQQPLRYNYEQPGFVEREKENMCGGKAYTIYGVKEVKECAKGSSGRHHQLVRAFSLRDNNSNYTKIPRAYSVNAGGRHVMPMECETCGKGGIGIVFLGLPGNETSFCKSCKSSAGSGWGGHDKPLKKKKSILDYCRKILRLPQKSR